MRGKFEGMQVGAYCIHRSWGLGRIQAYDERENKLIIDFEGQQKGHGMDPAFCINRLEILPEEHILVRHRSNPDKIEEMLKKRPTDVIVAILEQMVDNAASTAEIERQLKRLMGETRYRKWWLATRKQLVKDPRVAEPKKKTAPYILRDEPVKAEEEILEEFFAIKAPKKQIILAEKLLLLSISHEELQDHLPDILKILTKGLQESKLLSHGERLHGLWVRNDLARFIHEDVESLSPTSVSILQTVRNLSELVDQIPPSYHKRFLDLIHRSYGEQGQKVIFDLLKSSAGKFTNECINFLIEQDLVELLKQTLERWLNEQNLRGPLLYWIVKYRNSRKFGHMLHDLISPRLFNAILFAVDYESLQTAGARRIALADVLSDDSALISELLSEATPETANDLATSLILNQGFEDLTKKSLLARFIRHFPSVQNLLSSDDSAVEDDDLQGDDSLIVSRESYDKYKNDYETIVGTKIPENKRAIALAREHGDLRENAEYKMARQDQDALLARKSQMEQDLARARISDFTEAPTDQIGVGNTVELIVGSTGDSVTYSILGAWDSKPDENILSYKTPLGQSLISKKEGDSVQTIIGETEEEWTVKRIARWVDHRSARGE